MNGQTPQVGDLETPIGGWDTKPPTTIEEYSKEQLLAALAAQGHEVQIKGPGAKLPEPKPLELGQMRQANLVLRLSQFQTVIKTNVTPAEAFVLVVEHQATAQDMPLIDVVEVDPVTRTGLEEVRRLKTKYPSNEIDALFGPEARVPDTYQTAVEQGMTRGPAQAKDRFLELTKIA